MRTVSIINITSYTALELVRLLAQHPEFRVVSVIGRSAVGKRLEEIFPHLRRLPPPSGQQTPGVDPALVITEEPAQTDLAFVCLPHAAAASAVERLIECGIKVVDLSADFRLHESEVYEEWYTHTHPAPALLKSAVYGLPERYREQVCHSQLVANPGCHSTAAILALTPALVAGIVGPNVIITSITGISGGGRTPALSYHYPEANEDAWAYSLAGHRHLPEIVQELEAAAATGGHPVEGGLRLTFVPHIAPMTRGILSTSYAELRADDQGHIPANEELYALYRDFYANESFVHVVDQAPHTKWTVGSNHCFLYPIVDKRTQRLIVVACLDNLVKGASGQAIQNANLLCGFPETLGLVGLGMVP
ncbi:N-acetyl-gamma-glutamyl-phosphate reductase [Ktedonospora formicarum]|uniref:N-acetyl-gamma-glutamyl-phosphate reductase n=1 Tax=Ktedonospora formicarum TaxID=2778364 RepID=A0A8J3I3G7_9CHLR|nr:N-acetyl-gamma-glutamyl-phosphate reductase [Ktedonospora formicarum]GHO46058.1 N-acetyl-gamma-glutamyl-phosphate reductase [Ktedonospora formicarum]